MHMNVEVPVEASKHEIWKLITDIEHAPDRISGIEELEVLETPSEGLVGLKWRETRVFGGKKATETMWVTEAVDESHYRTEASSHGSVYRSRMYITEDGDATRLGMDFDCEPQSFGAKVMWLVFGFMFRGATRKALLQDLTDIKAAAESAPSES